MLGAGFARNRISCAASMASPPYLVRADGAARLRRSAAPSADIWRFGEIEIDLPNENANPMPEMGAISLVLSLQWNFL